MKETKKIISPFSSPLIMRLEEIRRDLNKGVKFPFSSLLSAYVGDPQGFGLKPMTFVRQVINLCVDPSLLEINLFPDDAKDRARAILQNCRNSTIGSYSFCFGNLFIRQQVADHIALRDGTPASAEDILLFNGATEAIRINYFLDEEHQWNIDIDELRRSVHESRKNCHPKILIVVNPGNPSAYVLSRIEIQNIIRFAYEEKLIIFADEIYQENVYEDECEFLSFKKVMSEMDKPYCDMQLVSFSGCSKGYIAECGARSGYCEVVNFDAALKKILLNLRALAMGPNIIGQVVMSCFADPPKIYEPSYDLFIKEKTRNLQLLKESAKLCNEKLNSIDGMYCNQIAGGMYVFPRIHLPQKAIQEAEKRGQSPDEFYVNELLERKGVCVFPGSMYGQKMNTYHFRMTILPNMEILTEVIERILSFHVEFMKEFEDVKK